MGSAKQSVDDLGRTVGNITTDFFSTVESSLGPTRDGKPKEFLTDVTKARMKQDETRRQTVQSIYEAIGKRKKGNTILTQPGQQVGPRFSDQQSISTLLTGGRSGNVR